MVLGAFSKPRNLQSSASASSDLETPSCSGWAQQIFIGVFRGSAARQKKLRADGRCPVVVRLYLRNF
jgi:hypothetical protein